MLLHADSSEDIAAVTAVVSAAGLQPVGSMCKVAMQILQPGSEHHFQHCFSHGLQHGGGSANRRRENRQADGLDLVITHHISNSQISQAHRGMQVYLNLQYFACCGGAPLACIVLAEMCMSQCNHLCCTAALSRAAVALQVHQRSGYLPAAAWNSEGCVSRTIEGPCSGEST
jgi:hypothetical protein